jgi:hypothetical protein
MIQGHIIIRIYGTPVGSVIGEERFELSGVGIKIDSETV